MVETIGRIPFCLMTSPRSLAGGCIPIPFCSQCPLTSPNESYTPRIGDSFRLSLLWAKSITTPVWIYALSFHFSIPRGLGKIYGRSNRVKPGFLRVQGMNHSILERKLPGWQLSRGSLGKLHPSSSVSWGLTCPSGPCPALPSSLKSLLQFPAHRKRGLLWAPWQPCWPTHWEGYFHLNVLHPPQALPLDTASFQGHQKATHTPPRAQGSFGGLFPDQGLSIKHITDRTMLCHNML